MREQNWLGAGRSMVCCSTAKVLWHSPRCTWLPRYQALTLQKMVIQSHLGACSRIYGTWGQLREGWVR